MKFLRQKILWLIKKLVRPECKESEQENVHDELGEAGDPMSRLFASGGLGASASASVLLTLCIT